MVPEAKSNVWEEFGEKMEGEFGLAQKGPERSLLCSARVRDLLDFLIPREVLESGQGASSLVKGHQGGSLERSLVAKSHSCF